MPIKKDNRDRYPANWKSEIVPRIAARAAGQCECTGQCGSIRCIANHGQPRCTALNREPHPVTGAHVILTTAHLNQQPEDCRDSNLASLCQLCHLSLDRDQHASTRRQTREKKLGLQPLWTEEDQS